MRKSEIEIQKRNISTETAVFIRREKENGWRNMRKGRKVVLSGEGGEWKRRKGILKLWNADCK